MPEGIAKFFVCKFLLNKRFILNFFFQIKIVCFLLFNNYDSCISIHFEIYIVWFTWKRKIIVAWAKRVLNSLYMKKLIFDIGQSYHINFINLNQTEFRLVKKQMENCKHNHNSFNCNLVNWHQTKFRLIKKQMENYKHNHISVNFPRRNRFIFVRANGSSISSWLRTSAGIFPRN